MLQNNADKRNNDINIGLNTMRVSFEKTPSFLLENYLNKLEWY